MEQLSIASFLNHGHAFHLYAYDEIENVPPGTIVKSADDILPSSEIFRYRDHPSYAGFANFFRYKLLLLKGGWWADSDVICLKPFCFPEAYAFSRERHRNRTYLNATVIKSPAGSPAMDYAVHICNEKNSAELKWGDTGSKLITDLTERFDLNRYIKPCHTFCPVPSAQWEKVLDAEDSAGPHPSAHGLHLWNEMWRRAGRDKDAAYDPRCLYEQLKHQILA